MGAISKLAAVNRILRAAGQQPVSTLAGSSINDTTIAEQILDEMVIEIQISGLDSNVTFVTKTPDSNGIIGLPKDTLAADGWAGDYGRRFSVRGSGSSFTLYDMDNDTDVFESPVTLKLTRGLSYDALETAHQLWAADAAAVLYQMQAVGDPQQNALLVQKAGASRRNARAHDMRQQQARRDDRDDLARQGMMRDITAWW